MVEHRMGRVDDAVVLRHGIVSVSDKRDLADFIGQILEASPHLSLLSTGGTFRALKEALSDSERVTEISEYTGQPETHGGLVKTLDWRIYLGILGEAHNDHHIADRERTDAKLFDLIVVNLYPFREAIASSESDLEQARGNIDIGGPTMIRAAAKNFPRVAVVCDPADYPHVIDEVRAGDGALSLSTRFELARKAFAHVAEYDAAIDAYLRELNPSVAAATYLNAEEE